MNIQPGWWVQLQMWADRYRALEQTHAVIVDRWLTAEERVKELDAALHEIASEPTSSGRIHVAIAERALYQGEK